MKNQYKKRMGIMALLFGLVAGMHADGFADYVNPLVGTQSDYTFSAGNTYPAIAMPWGMNFWTPQTGRMGDGWCYTYGARRIRGIKQTHQPSPWINDYGQWSVMPVVGNRLTEEERQSWFSHKAETALPYYYGVYLADWDVKAEVVPTERAALFRFTFPATDSARVVLDAFDKGSCVRLIPSENKIVGWSTRNSGGVPANFRNYFVVRFDRPVRLATWSQEDGNAVLSDLPELQADHAGAVAMFSTKRGEQVLMRVASSFISVEQAERNLRELGGDSFAELKARGAERWNEVLGRIEIEAPLDVKRTFYSCLYRSLLFPRMFYEYDASGQPYHYSPFNGKVLPGYLFADTGFWDTFRCLYPLLNLVYPDVSARMQQGLLNTFRESGFLPEWASPGHRDCMVGNNSASVVSDAIVKGVTPPDCCQPLYEAMLATANSVHPDVSSTGRLGYEWYNRLGYVPCDVGINESAARTLEYAYDDWCIAQAGRKLGRPARETDVYLKRAQNYRHLFDSSVGLMRGRRKDGAFSTPFNPFKWGGDFTEGNSWHYTWSVFHDIPGLIGLMGGPDRFVGKLDSVFLLPPLFDESYYGTVIHEIREMQVMDMGNYAHGNQPIQHAIYLYDYAGAPRRAQYWLREVMNRFYSAAPDGYCGDEDNGQTSAWYVFSALGFYPVCPASFDYAVGAPLVDGALLHLTEGRDLKIMAPGNSDDCRYVRSLRFNGSVLGRPFLDHRELTKGGVLTFEMGE